MHKLGFRHRCWLFCFFHLLRCRRHFQTVRLHRPRRFLAGRVSTFRDDLLDCLHCTFVLDVCETRASMETTSSLTAMRLVDYPAELLGMACLCANAVLVMQPTGRTIHRWVCVAAWALLSSTSHARTAGAVIFNIGAEAHIHVGEQLLAGDRVYMQYPDRGGEARCCFVRGIHAFEAVASNPAASDAFSGNPVFSYRLIRSLRLKNKKPFLGAALVGKSIQVRQAENGSLRVSGSSPLLVLTTCTSREGFHVFGNAGNEAVSDIYLGLGYEVEEPTCPSK
jgi:hypothetical protein